jgi:ABC-type transport system involved in multi-copper enzyme maturation permease subunit
MNTWSLSRHGLATVIGLEARQRLRSRRWLIALAAWFVFIGAIAALVMWGVYSSYSSNFCVGLCPLRDTPAGQTAFGVVTLFIVGMGFVIAPAFTATSINGDRAQGTLATLQATRLSAVEIAGGKLVAAWATAAIFLAVALPYIVVIMVLGRIPVLQVVVCFLVTCLLVAVLCAIGLGWSALFNRAAASTVMTYLSAVGLTLITPLVLLASLPFLDGEITVRVWGLSEQQADAYQRTIDQAWADNDFANLGPPPVEQCQWRDSVEFVQRPDRAWWVLVANPFVIVSDAAPAAASADPSNAVGSDPLSAISYGVREMARGPQLERDDCLSLYWMSPAYTTEWGPTGELIVTDWAGHRVDLPDSPVQERPPLSDTPIWPWGLAVNLLIGAVFFHQAVRRLRIPYHHLPKGTRVA